MRQQDETMTLRYNPDFAEVQLGTGADYRIAAKVSDELTEDEQERLGTQFATSGVSLDLLAEFQEFYSQAAHCFHELSECLADLARRVDNQLRVNGRTPQQPIWETDRETRSRRARERRMAKKEAKV